MSLSETQKSLVRQSYALIASQPQAVGRTFYERLFEVAPGVKPLFKGDVEAQATKLMQMIAVAVHNLEASDVLVPALQGLAKRHVGYGALPEHYPVVGETLLWALKHQLGEAFTPDVEDAWAATFNLLASIMIESAYDKAG